MSVTSALGRLKQEVHLNFKVSLVYTVSEQAGMHSKTVSKNKNNNKPQYPTTET